VLNPGYFTSDQKWHYTVDGSDVFVLLSGKQKSAGVATGLAGIVKKYYGEDQASYRTRTRLSLQPLADMHLDERFETYKGDSLTKRTLWSLAAIGVFLLLVACINFINLSTAQSVNRAKEIGVRKVLGSRRSQLARQFLTETALITLIALVLGCILAQ